MEKISIIGLGRAGGALAIALRRAGFEVGQLIYRRDRPTIDWFDDSYFVSINRLSRIIGDVLIVATADPDIRPAAEVLAKLDEIPPIALHLSGSLNSDELAPLRSKGTTVGSMHPLVSISEPALGAARFGGAYFCIEGDDNAVAVAQKIVNKLGGKCFSIERELKPLYHASAVMASGNVIALFDAAIELLSKCGVESSRAHEILLPLLRSTVANLGERSTKDALTGPFVRGDLISLERHLKAFDGRVDETLRTIYLDLAERSVRLAGVENSEILLDAIVIAKRETRC